MDLIIILVLITSLLSIIFFFASFFLRKRSRLPSGNIIYSDSIKMPGELLIAKRIPLSGRPDYLIKDKGEIIPVELKRGRTPLSPFPSHIAQLFAYCYLVEDFYLKRPRYGVIDYPENNFKLEFTTDAVMNIEKLVKEMIKKKQSQLDRSNLSNVCSTCKEHTMKTE